MAEPCEKKVMDASFVNEKAAVQNDMKTARFIIITVLPHRIRNAIERFRTTLAGVSGSRSALAYPPHVTLRTGTLVPETKIPQFIDEFGWTVCNAPSCSMESEPIEKGTYNQNGNLKYFIYYPIKKTSQVLAFHRALYAYEPFRKGEQRDYFPHLTLAFDDLTPDGRDRILDFIRERPETVPPLFRFRIDNVSLYAERGDRWQPYRLFHLPV
jgi:2'-5' RNA ligase